MVAQNISIKKQFKIVTADNDKKNYHIMNEFNKLVPKEFQKYN